MSVTLASVGLSTLTLPNFDLGNTDSEDNRTQFKFSMNGTPYSYTSTPSVLVKHLVFSNLSSDLAASLLSFLEASASAVVVITKYPGPTVFSGKMLMNTFTDTVTSRKNGHTIAIDFTTNI